VNTALAAPVLPSVSVTPLTDSEGDGSSSWIVATPSPSAIVAFFGFESRTRIVSSSSSSWSPHGDHDLGGELIPGEREGPRLGDVVRSGGCRAVGRGVVHGDGLVPLRVAQRDGERDADRSRVALEDGRVADGERRRGQLRFERLEVHAPAPVAAHPCPITLAEYVPDPLHDRSPGTRDRSPNTGPGQGPPAGGSGARPGIRGVLDHKERRSRRRTSGEPGARTTLGEVSNDAGKVAGMALARFRPQHRWRTATDGIENSSFDKN